MAPATRKHLDNLLDDYSRRNKEIYGWEHSLSTPRPETDDDDKPPRMSVGSKLAMGMEVEEDADDSTKFDPPYCRPGITSKEVSRKVNSKRTPSGNFFETTNPSLHMEPKPRTKPLVEPLMHRAAHSIGRFTVTEEPAPLKLAKKQAAEADGDAAPVKATVTWGTPYNTADKKLGRSTAKLVSGKRTPSGGFVAPEGP